MWVFNDVLGALFVASGFFACRVVASNSVAGREALATPSGLTLAAAITG